MLAFTIYAASLRVLKINVPKLSAGRKKSIHTAKLLHMDATIIKKVHFVLKGPNVLQTLQAHLHFSSTIEHFDLSLSFLTV